MNEIKPKWQVGQTVVSVNNPELEYLVVGIQVNHSALVGEAQDVARLMLSYFIQVVRPPVITYWLIPREFSSYAVKTQSPGWTPMFQVFQQGDADTTTDFKLKE